ncbi:L,D-transpeptidase [Aestuariivirga litoralis]|nr:L,D-transpeptidase [Aestuariivirga litoralis]
MRNILVALMLAVLPAAGLGAHAVAATSPTAEQQILLKKKQQAEAEARKQAAAKKAADAKKAAEARRKADSKKAADARKAQQARKLADQKKLADKKKQAAARKAQQPGWACEGFLECLFQNQGRPRAGVQRASTRASSASTLASMDETTGEDIDWAPASKYAVGSIIVSTPERALYFVTGPGEARRYSVGVGREGFQWSGTSTIVNKAEWPTWRPPAEMIKREAAKGHMLPAEMAGGPENPLGARAMYIGGKLYRIHGTNSPGSIGTAASSGCIRMMNADVIELYDKVKIGARVYVYQ